MSKGVYGGFASVNLRKPDLEQDDPKKGDYVKGLVPPDRLPEGGFGWEERGGLVDILLESALVMDNTTQTMPMPDGRTLYGYLFHPLPIAAGLTDGEEYDVTIDGVAHRKSCVVPDISGIPYQLLGNLALLELGEDTGEDWVFFVQNTEHPTLPDADYWVGMFATTNTEYKSVAVSAQGVVIHKILDKFIPDTIPRFVDLPEYPGDTVVEYEYLGAVPYEDFRDRKLIICRKYNESNDEYADSSDCPLLIIPYGEEQREDNGNVYMHYILHDRLGETAVGIRGRNRNGEVYGSQKGLMTHVRHPEEPVADGQTIVADYVVDGKVLRWRPATLPTDEHIKNLIASELGPIEAALAEI